MGFEGGLCVCDLVCFNCNYGSAIIVSVITSILDL